MRYEFVEPLAAIVHCHCSMCRKHNGASFATFAVAPAGSLRWLAGEGHIGRYRSSERGERTYCTRCGSVTPMPLPGTGLEIAPAGNLEGDPGIRPTTHIFVGSKAPWYTITDSLPRHEGYPPELGGGLGLERPPVEAPAGVTLGSCLCGGVAYELRAPLRMYNCHCSRCRRGRSAAHATNLFVRPEDFRLTRGEELIAEYKVPDAQRFTVAFCTRCGSDVPRYFKERGIVNVPAGTLDTDPGVRPQANIFVASKAAWFDVTDGLPQYAEAPPL
ncbi:MAG TPA: GFA family protein [Gammaproteobacteria bacterium]